jgi:hypothetical protein
MRVLDALRRSSGLLLAVLFLAGEIGWSGVDALAFHSGSAHTPPAARTAASPSGPNAVLLGGSRSRGDHAAHCVLGFTTGSARAAGPLALDIRPEPEVALRTEAASARAGSRSDPGTLARPRAPPAPTS